MIDYQSITRYESSMKKKRVSFSDELRNAIESAELSRYQLSQMAGIDAATLSRFVNGKGGMSIDGLDKIAAALGLHVAIEQPKRQAKGK